MFGLRRCISVAKVTNLFTTTGYLTPTTLPCLKFLSTESIRDRSKKIFIESNVFREPEVDLGILKEVCGTEYIPEILFRGKGGILAELRSSEEAKLLVEKCERGHVKIGDQYFRISPSLGREQETEYRTERYNERCSMRVIIRGIPESTSDNKEENEEHSLKAVKKILSHLGSECQVLYAYPAGEKQADRSRGVIALFPCQEDVQSLLNDGKVKTVKIGEHKLYINPFVPRNTYKEERSKNKNHIVT